MEIGQLPPKAPLGPSASMEEIDKLYGQLEIGNAAETVIRMLDPIIEERLGRLLDELGKCAPELGLILDVRARISEAWRLRKEITAKAAEGKRAINKLQAIFQTTKPSTTVR